MSAKLASLLAMLLILSAACAQPEPEMAEPEAEEPAAAEAEGPVDPIVVDAAHYAAEFENDQVRIVRITYGPGEESVMHHHPDSVAVFLTDHLVQMTMPDGSTDEISANAGDALFIPAGDHLPKNISDGPWGLVLVELKGGGVAAEPSGDDPVVVDPDHYSSEFDNDLVRIVRITYGAGEESIMHYHPDGVAVFLTDMVAQMTMPDGSSEELAASAGDAIFAPAGQHQPTNASGEPLEVIQIELK